MRRLFLTLLLTAAAAWAGPDDPSKFDASPLGAQHVVYQLNFENPQDLEQGLGYLNNHIKALKSFGDFEHSKWVVVAHGNELHMLSRLNRATYPDIYDELKALSDQGVLFRVCRNAANFRGYKPEDFYDTVTVVPAAMTELAMWQAKGYAYISGAVIRRTKRVGGPTVVPNPNSVSELNVTSD
jgi:intracellular sulfur oxidation DsrE/DsrF family protein